MVTSQVLKKQVANWISSMFEKSDSGLMLCWIRSQDEGGGGRSHGAAIQNFRKLYCPTAGLPPSTFQFTQICTRASPHYGTVCTWLSKGLSGVDHFDEFLSYFRPLWPESGAELRGPNGLSVAVGWSQVSCGSCQERVIKEWVIDNRVSKRAEFYLSREGKSRKALETL
jgi:hypothetical protein